MKKTTIKAKKKIIKKPITKKTSRKPTVKKIAKKTPATKTVKKVVRKTTTKPAIKRTTKSKVIKQTVEKKDNINESLKVLHREMERSLKRIEDMMKEIQHKEHHPKIKNAIKKFHTKQKKHIEQLRKKV